MMSDSKKDIRLQHTLELHERSKMLITGVNDVSEFSERLVKLKTNMGGLIIKGSNLSITKLNTPNGDVEINGNIDFVQYQNKQNDGFLAKLLK